MSKVTLVFTRHRSLLSAALRGALWCPYSHVGIYDPEKGTVIEAHARLGVIERPYDQAIKSASAWLHVDVPASSPQAVIDAARSQLTMKYDWLGVIGYAVRRRFWEGKGSWFCSELVAWAFHQGGTPLFNAAPCRITPRDLYILKT